MIASSFTPAERRSRGYDTGHTYSAVKEVKGEKRGTIHGLIGRVSSSVHAVPAMPMTRRSSG